MSKTTQQQNTGRMERPNNRNNGIMEEWKKEKRRKSGMLEGWNKRKPE